MSGHEKFYIPHDDLVSLEAAMASLEAATGILQAKIEILSGKMGTPANLAEMITGFSAEFDFRDIGHFDAVTNFVAGIHRSLTFDGNYFYTYQANMSRIIRWAWDSITQATFYDPATDMAGLCWDTVNSRLIAVQDNAINAEIYTISSAGALLDTQTLSYSDWADTHPLAVCHDEQNDKFYIVVKSDTEEVVAIGEVSPSTGVISSAVEFARTVLLWTRDMEYINGVLALLLSDEDYDKVIAFRVGETSPLSFSSSPLAPHDNFCIDKAMKLLYFFSKYPNDAAGDEIKYVMRRSLAFAPPHRIIDGGESITVDGAVATTPSSTADLDDLETTLDALETLLGGTAKVKVWDGTRELFIANQLDTAGVRGGTVVYGVHADATSDLDMLPVAHHGDALAYKGERVIPVTPMTGERKEGTYVVDAAGNKQPAMDAVARPGFVKVTDGAETMELVTPGVSVSTPAPGPMTYGRRASGTQAWPLPVALAADALDHKGSVIVPVTPITGQSEEGTKTHTNDSCFVVSYEANAVEAKTGYVLIDLSNATNYPHTEVNEIHVDWLAFSMLGDVSCEGHVHIGFISTIDATKGTMISFVCKPADKIARASFVSRQYNPSAVRCKTAAVLAGGGMKIVDDTTFQNDVALAGTYEAVIPAVGDLVMLIDRVAGTFDTVSVAIGYHTI